MTRKIALTVNDDPIEMDYFVQSFIDHTVRGIVQALEHPGDIDDLEVTLRGEDVRIVLNQETVPLNTFVTRLVSNTLRGLISSLKGVEEISLVKIAISG